MPVPVIAAGISAIGGIIGAKVASNAAGKAADQQVASGAEAQGRLDQAYNQTFVPAFSTLSQLSGLPAVQPFGATPPGQAGAPMAGVDPARAQALANQQAQGHGVKRPIDPQALANQQAQGHSLASVANPAQVAAKAQTATGFHGGGTVKMIAPTGELADVPSQMVAALEQQGARRA
jgi:hypothetical protein